jgi:putative AlgH/UPF0301 family transcriptional regulator
MNQHTQDLWRYAVVTVGSQEHFTHNRGFILNQAVLNIDHKQITQIYGLEHTLPHVPVYCGGPIHTDRCTVLHTPEYRIAKTKQFNSECCITWDNDIIRDIVQGRGPRQWKIMLGHCEWQDGQLDAEIMRPGGWQEAPWCHTAWGGYKRKDKMWRRIIEQNSVMHANSFLDQVFSE